MGRTVRRTTLLLATSVLTAGLLGSASAQTIYETSFEADQGFTLGDLNGQGIWTVSGTGGANVVDNTAGEGQYSVHQEADSTIMAEAQSSANRVIIRAWHNGTGTDQPLTAPDATTMAAAILGFESTGVDTYVVKGFDGPADTGGYIAPDSPMQLSTTEWNKIVVSVNYDTQTFDVAVNDTAYLQGLSFFNSSVTSFNGFQASSQASANIDLVGFYASDGDFDDDGVSDDLEMALGGDPLDPNVTGPAGDVNEDGLLNIVDALLYGRVASGALTQGSLVIQDLNGDSATDMDDAEKLYQFVNDSGEPDYLRK